MATVLPSLVTIHVVANLVWIGAILSVAFTLTSRSATPRDRGALAVELYKKLAIPGLVISVLAGVARLAYSTDYYFVQTKFMHGKLLFAVIVIAIHHVIGARAKAMAKGKNEQASAMGPLAIVLLLSASTAALFAVFKPF